MPAIVNTKFLLSALNQFGTDCIAAKVVQQNGADVSPTADTFNELPFLKDIQVDDGAAAKDAQGASGNIRHYDDAYKPKIVLTFFDRSTNLMNLAMKTLGTSHPYIRLFVQLSATDVDGTGTRQFMNVGPCYVEKQRSFKLEGNEIKVTLFPEVSGVAYGGLTAADLANLASMDYPPVPGVALASSDFAYGAGAPIGQIFTK